MERRKLNKSKLGHSSRPEKKQGKLAVIVKVKQAGYVPDELDLRTRIDDYLFTADTSAELIQKLKNNPAIESISLNEKLPPID